MVSFQNFLLESARAADFLLSESAAERFAIYYKELIQWNARVNLTTLTEPEDAAIKHFLDSALVMRYAKLSGSLLDIGAGAGFPGIPLKVLNPQLHIVLVEAVRKKASFLKQVIRLLKLEGIEVYNGRIEDFERYNAFDGAVSRAFAELGLFCRLAAPFLKPGAMLLAMKGSDTKELAAAQETPPAGFTFAALHSYELPQHRGKRSLVVLQKCFT